MGVTGARLLSINSSTGAVTLTANPDYEGKPSYSFTVTATDTASNVSSAQAVTLAILNKDRSEERRAATERTTAIAENRGADQMVNTVVADEAPDVGYLSDGTALPLT